MNNRFVNAVMMASIVHLGGAAVSGAETRWSRLAPQGAGFSVEAPGDPQPGAKPEQYTYTSGLWFLGVEIQAVDPSTRQLVERREHKALVRCLESLRDSMVASIAATRRGSSSGDVDGYPSLRFSMESTELEAINLLVLTADRLFLVMTVGPKGSRDDDAKRFVRSFRLVATESAPAAASADVKTPSNNPAAAKLEGPMLAVARLLIEQKMNPLIDEVLQNAPPAARLGARWSPSSAAWQQARTSFSSRIDRVLGAYEESDDVARTLESEFERLAPESRAALVAALNGPAGPAIVRELALSQFIVTTMAEDPAAPQPGERAWQEKMRALQTVFDRRAGSAMPRDDGAHGAEVEAYFSAAGSDPSRICLAVVSKAMRELETAINLTLFDNSETIQREIETVIARVK